MQFSAGLRYLLAHDKRLARVTLNGVTIQIGKQKFNYRGRRNRAPGWPGSLAWFDPENPESMLSPIWTEQIRFVLRARKIRMRWKV